MNPLGYLKIGGGVLGAIALVALALLAADRFHQKELADNAKACAVAAADTDDTAALDRCLPEVRAEIGEARQARLCERTLLPSLRPETRFAMSQACGAGVKRLVASGDALAAERDGLKARLTAAQNDLATAVARAERRAATNQERNAHGQKVIQAAPRDAAGSIRCDAECLRRLNQ